jgi:hypothetical protein
MYLMSMNDKKFKPALLTKKFRMPNFRCIRNFMFNDKFVVGLAYRWSAAVLWLNFKLLTECIWIWYDHELLI